jgi:CHAD domain-containing protein
MTEPAEYQPEQGSRSAEPSPILAHLGEVSAAMHERLGACRMARHDPHVEAVHHLRTGTRRVEATLDTLAREAGAHGLGRVAEEARQRWLRLLKKVRRAAGTVRDLDVHRELLAENYLPKESESTEGTPAPAESELVGQARALDHWLKSRRAAAAEALCATLDDLVNRLLETEQEFMAAIAQRRSLASRSHRPAARLALEDYLRLVDAMPLLDKENLHDFRKGAKKARYIGESDESDPAAKAIAKTIKRVQDAIGEWHDWEVVALEATEALGKDGKVLHSELEARAEDAYENAMRLTATANRRVVGEWQALSPRRRIRRATS